jgi:hypothetical protein
LNDLARKAGALTAAIQGMNRGDLDNEDITGGIEDIAWEIRDDFGNYLTTFVPMMA